MLSLMICLGRDQDGVQDNQDNCPSIANADQLDTDNDGMGKSIYPPSTAPAPAHYLTVVNTDQLNSDDDNNVK